MPEFLGNVSSWVQGQKDKYLGPKQETSESKSEQLKEHEKESILSATEIHADPYNGKKLTVAELRSHGLAPKTTFDVDGVKFAISDPYEIHDRLAVVAYVQAGNGRFVARSYYRSNSQGIWRLLPAYLTDGQGNVAWFGKDVNETAITAPIAVQKQLADISRQTPIKLAGSEESVFAGLSRDLTSGNPGTMVLNVDRMGQNLGLDTDALTKTGLLEPNKNKAKRSPENVILPEQLRPNFLKVISTWTQPTDLYGDITVEVFASMDKTLKYMINRDSKGRVWIGGIENNSKIDDKGIGLRRQWINEPDLTTPAYEYKAQAAGYANFNDRNGEYVDMSTNYLNKIPLIIEYKASLAQRKQGAEQVVPVSPELTKKNQELGLKAKAVADLVPGLLAFINLDVDVSQTKYQQKINAVVTTMEAVKGNKVAAKDVNKAVDNAEKVLKEITDHLPLRFSPDASTGDLISLLSFGGGAGVPLETGFTTEVVQQKLTEIEKTNPELKKQIKEELAKLDIKEKKSSVKESFLSFAKETFAKGQNILEEVYKNVKNRLASKAPVEKIFQVTDLPEIDSDGGAVEAEVEPPTKVGVWDRLKTTVRKKVASGINILDQKVQQHQENKEKSSLEYQVREAVAAAIEYPIDMVEMTSTFADLGLFLYTSGPDTVKFKKVIEKLGLSKLDFTITESATVADIVEAVRTQRAAAKISTVSYGTDKYKPKDDPGMSEADLAKSESLRSLAKRRKDLQDEIVEILKKLEADDGLTPNEKKALETQKTKLADEIKEIDAAKETTGRRFLDRVHWQPIMLAGTQILARMGISMGARAGLTALMGFGAPLAAVTVGEAMAVANVANQVRKAESRLKEEGVETGLHRRALYDVTTRDREESKDLHGWRKGVDTLGWALDLPTNQLMQLAANISRDRRQANRIIGEIDSMGGVDNWFSRVSENEVKRFARYLTRLRMMGYGRIDLKNRDGRDADATKFEEKHAEIHQLVESKLRDPNLTSKKKYELWQKNGSLDSAKLQYDAKGQYLKMAVAVAAGKFATLGAGSMVGLFLGDVVHNVADGQNLTQAVGSTAREAGQHVQQVAEHGGQVVKGVAQDVDAATGVSRLVDQAGDQIKQTTGQIHNEIDQLRGISYPEVSPALSEPPPVVSPGVKTAIDLTHQSQLDTVTMGSNEQPQLSVTDRLRHRIEQMRQTGLQAQESATNATTTAGIGRDSLVPDSSGTDDIPSTRNILNDAKDVIGNIKDHLVTLGYDQGVEHTFQVTGGESPEILADKFNATFHTTESGIFADGVSYSSEAANSLDIAFASGRDAFTKPEIYDLFVKQFTETFHVQPGSQMVSYQDLIDHPEIKATFDQLVFAPGKEAVIPKILHRLAAPNTYAALRNLKPR